MTNHVPTLATCQKLEEAGFPREAHHFWWRKLSQPEDDFEIVTKYEWYQRRVLRVAQEFFAAPLLTEILERLPKQIGKLESRKTLTMSYDYDEWFIGYLGENESRAEKFSRDANPAEAAALLWLELNKKV